MLLLLPKDVNFIFVITAAGDVPHGDPVMSHCITHSFEIICRGWKVGQQHWIFTCAIRVRIPSGTRDFFKLFIILITNFHIRKSPAFVLSDSSSK